MSIVPVATRLVTSALLVVGSVTTSANWIVAAASPAALLDFQERVAVPDGPVASERSNARAAAGASLTLAAGEDCNIDAGNDFDWESLHRTYTLVNSGAETVHWQARASQPWIAFSGASNGALLPGQSVDVAIGVDPLAANRDSDETALGTLEFVDLDTSAVAATRQVSVAPQFTPSAGGAALMGSGASHGWTQFTPSSDTRKVFVSSSHGSDQNNGLTQATAKRTIAAAIPLLRDGYPDWLLLARGDVWHESLGQWKKSGRSPTERMLVTTYGRERDRPLLETGLQHGIFTNGSNGSPASIDNLAIVGVHFHADAYTGAGDCIGAQMLQPSSHLLIEDCEFQGYALNLVFQGYGGRHTDFRLRRSIVVDAYAVHSIGGHSQGLYAYAVDGLLIEENVFDHNGWNESVPGAGADMFSHNLYIDNDNTGVVVRGNIIANASSHGIQLRPGGSLVNNVFVRNSIALSVGGGNNPEYGGVTANVRGNVVLDGKDIDAANPRGWAMWFANIASGHVVNNLIANNTLGGQPSVMMLAGTHVGDTHSSIGIHDLTIEKNIVFNWGGGIRIEGDSSQVTNVQFKQNDVQITNSPDALLDHTAANSTSSITSAYNQFFSQVAPSTAWTVIGSTPHSIAYWLGQVGDSTSVTQAVAYTAPNRSPATYSAMLGDAPDVTTFLAQARRQSSAQWRPAYCAVAVARYIRQGF